MCLPAFILLGMGGVEYSGAGSDPCLNFSSLTWVERVGREGKGHVMRTATFPEPIHKMNLVKADFLTADSTDNTDEVINKSGPSA